MPHLTVQRVHALWTSMNSNQHDRLTTGWLLCAHAAGLCRCRPGISIHHLSSHSFHFVGAVCCLVGVSVTDSFTPSSDALRMFGDCLDTFGVRGQFLAYVGKYGPSPWEQRHYQLKRNLSSAESVGNSKRQQKWQVALDAHLSIPFMLDFAADVCVIESLPTPSPNLTS